MLNKENLHTPLINSLLELLKPDTQPQWGLMSAQHMVEHLADLARVSSGKAQVPVLTPVEKLERYKEKGLFADDPWPANFKNPFLEPGQLNKLRSASLEEAKAFMIKEMQAFHASFQENPLLTRNHPVYGPLSYEDWKQFHYKHLRHHFTQFGLL
jgi:hypothetical protein